MSDDDKKWLDLLDTKLKKSGVIVRAMFKDLAESSSLLSELIRRLSLLNKYELGQLSINKTPTQAAKDAIAVLDKWLSALGNNVYVGLRKSIDLSIDVISVASKAANEMLVLGYTVADISKLVVSKTKDLLMAKIRTVARNNTIQDLNAYLFGTQAKANKDGLISQIKRSFIYHVSNTTAAAFNFGNELIWSMQGVKSIRLIATIDNKTSDYCESIHKKVYPIMQGPRPPFHPHCRTIVVPN